MSLTKIQKPNILTPVNDLIPIVYGSDHADQDGFRYKLTLKYSGVTDIVDIWVWPDPNKSNIGAYNANQIYRDYISYDKSKWNTKYPSNLNDVLIDFSYDITEYIGSTSGDTSGSTTFYTFRGVSNYSNPFDYTEYILTGSTGKFLSKWEGNRILKTDEYSTINALCGDISGTTSRISVIKFYIKNQSYFIKNNISLSGLYICCLPIGPQNIQDAINNDLLYQWPDAPGEVTPLVPSGTTLIDDTVNDYTFSVYYSGSTSPMVQSSETKTIELNHNCNRWDGTQFLWLGDLSTFETFTFDFANLKEYEHSRDEIKKDLYTLSSSNGYTYSIGDRERKNININTIEKHTAISGWLDDELSSNLMELYRSPEVYIIENNNLIPIIITTTEIEEKKKINNDKLFNHIIEYETSYDIKNNL